MVELEKPSQNRSPLHIVSYFEHEKKPGFDFSSDLDEILQAGFNGLVICVSELTLGDKSLITTVNDMTKQAHENKIMCLADPWGLGKVFGGEADSPYNRSGAKACFCDPRFDQLVTTWIKTVSDAGFDGVFWDEPEYKCPDHNNVSVISHYSQMTHDLGLYNSVCLPADEARLPELERMAALQTIDSIGTDPYYKNAFKRISREERPSYVASWSHFVVTDAEKYDKDDLLWLQGFNVSELEQISEALSAMEGEGVKNLAFWGFNGSASLFPDQAAQGFVPPEEVWAYAKNLFTLRQERIRREAGTICPVAP